MAMRVVSSFIGPNREFQGWLVAQMCPGKVVSLAEHREKRKAASRAARVKPVSPSIA